MIYNAYVNFHSQTMTYSGGIDYNNTQSGFHIGGVGEAKGAICPPPPPPPPPGSWGPPPPLDFDFILPHSLVVDAALLNISNTLVCPPLIKCLDETLTTKVYYISPKPSINFFGLHPIVKLLYSTTGKPTTCHQQRNLISQKFTVSSIKKVCHEYVFL